MQPNFEELGELAYKIHRILYVTKDYCKHNNSDMDIQNIQPLIDIALKDCGSLYCKIVDPQEC